jgi:acyl-CoA thioester hydrolase
MKKIDHIFVNNYRIYYEDTDSEGIVYYANYLKFFERARTDFLRSKNIIQSQIADLTKMIFVVRKCQIEYILPARLDDLITVTIEVIEIRGPFIFMKQEILKDQKLIATLEINLTAISNETFKPVRIPLSLSKKILAKKPRAKLSK